MCAKVRSTNLWRVRKVEIENEDFIIAPPYGGAKKRCKNKVEYFLSVPAWNYSKMSKTGWNEYT